MILFTESYKLFTFLFQPFCFQKVSVEELDTLADRLNDVTIAMYFADPDAFCKDLPLNEESDSRQTDAAVDETDAVGTSEEDVELVQVEIDEDEEENFKKNRDPVDNTVPCYSEIPLQPACKNNKMPEVRNVTETDPETVHCVRAAQDIQIPSTVVVQSVDMIKTDQGLIRKVIVVRVPGAQQTPRMMLLGPPKAAGPALPPSSSTTDVPAATSTVPPAPSSAKTSLTLKEKQKGKPPLTYMALVGKALLSSPDGHMCINSIYDYIMENYPFYRTTTLSWRNAIRHNLTVNECFVKAGKIGKSRFYQWGIHPDYLEAFRAGKYSGKPNLVRQNVKVVPDNHGNDSLGNRNTN